MPYTENAIRMAFFFWLFGIRMAFLDVYGILMCMAFCLAFCASEVCRNEFCFGGILLNAVDQFWHISSISFVFLPFSLFPAILLLQKKSQKPSLESVVRPSLCLLLHCRYTRIRSSKEGKNNRLLRVQDEEPQDSTQNL